MLDIAHETKGNWIGPCPVDEFFESMDAPPISKGETPAVGIPASYFQDMHISCEKDFNECLVSLLVYFSLLLTNIDSEGRSGEWKGYLPTATPGLLYRRLIQYNQHYL